MNRFFPRLFPVALLLLAACAGPRATTEAPEPATTTASPTASPEIRVSEYPLDAIEAPPLNAFDVPEPQRVELSNGLVVFLIEDHELPLVNARALVGGGSVFEPAEQVGLASITGTTMRTGGTAAMSADSLNAFLEGLGASIEAGFGELTGSASMSTLAENVDAVLPVFADVLRRPAFAEDQVSLAKAQAKSGISRRNDDPTAIAVRELYELIYGSDAPYARAPEYYTVDAISRDDVAAFHERFFVPNNVMLGIWGDFDADAMAEKLEAAFGDWAPQPGWTAPTPPAVDADRTYGVGLVPKEDVTQAAVLMGHVGEVTRAHPDYPSLLILNEVLSGGFGSRLMSEVRTKLGLAYAVQGQYTAGYDRPGEFFALVLTKNESTVEAAQAVLAEIEKLKAAPPTDEEVRIAKDAYLNSFVFNFDTKGEVVNRLLTYDYYGYPQDYLLGLQEAVEAVTPADVHRVAQAYLHPDVAKVLVVGNPAEFGEPLTALGAVEEIDITIPLTAPGAEGDVAAGTSEDGTARLTAVLDALGGADRFRNAETLVMANEQATPGGNVANETQALLPDLFHIQTTVPQGTITVVVTAEGAKVTTPMGSQTLPASAVGQIKGQLYAELPYLLTVASGFNPTLAGQEEVDGRTADVIRLEAPGMQAPIRLLVDAETSRPLKLALTQISMQGPTPTEIVFGDYADFGGLTLPGSGTIYQNGQELGTLTYERIEFGADVDESLFTLE